MSRPRGQTTHGGHEWRRPGWTRYQVGRKRPDEAFVDDVGTEPVAPGETARYLVDIRHVRSEPRSGGPALIQIACIYTDRDLGRWSYRWLTGEREADGEIAARDPSEYVSRVGLPAGDGEKSPPGYQGLGQSELLAQYRDVLQDAHGLDLVDLVADGGLPLYRICDECGERTYTYERCHNCGDVPWEDEEDERVRTDGGRRAYRRECVDAVRQEAGVGDDGPCPHHDPDCPGPYAEDGLPCADCFLDEVEDEEDEEQLVADGGSSSEGTAQDPFEEHRVMDVQVTSNARDGATIDVNGTQLFIKQGAVPVLSEIYIENESVPIGAINTARGETVCLGGVEESLADRVDKIREMPAEEIPEALDELAARLNPTRGESDE